eukprot:scaffold95719_cov42-Prasinocladus_malaysianus.AAC.1
MPAEGGMSPTRPRVDLDGFVRHHPLRRPHVHSCVSLCGAAVGVLRPGCLIMTPAEASALAIVSLAVGSQRHTQHTLMMQCSLRSGNQVLAQECMWHASHAKLQSFFRDFRLVATVYNYKELVRANPLQLAARLVFTWPLPAVSSRRVDPQWSPPRACLPGPASEEASQGRTEQSSGLRHPISQSINQSVRRPGSGGTGGEIRAGCSDWEASGAPARVGCQGRMTARHAQATAGPRARRCPQPSTPARPK